MPRLPTARQAGDRTPYHRFYPPSFDRLAGRTAGRRPRALCSRAMPRVEDEALRARALEALGPLGDALAREALERGSVGVEDDVVTWQGSQGVMLGHRLVVTLAADLHARAAARHATRDAVTAALSAAMAERPGHAVSDVRLEIGSAARASTPYRDR